MVRCLRCVICKQEKKKVVDALLVIFDSDFPAGRWSNRGSKRSLGSSTFSKAKSTKGLCFHLSFGFVVYLGAKKHRQNIIINKQPA